jgi:PAS domain S-box-containing protein
MNPTLSDSTNLDQPQTRILVVEDEELIYEYLVHILESSGYTVVGTTDTGEEAIERTLALKPDIVIMDIRLKGSMSGIQAAVAIRENLDVPVVFSTAFSEQQLLNGAKTAMPYGYLLKPYKESEVHAVLQMALLRHRFDCATRKNQQWLYAVLQAVSDGVVVCDAQERVLFLNPAAEQLTGHQQANALGISISKILPLIQELSGQYIPHPLIEAMHTGRSVNIPDATQLVRADGSRLPVADSCAPIKNDLGHIVGAVSVFRDDTAHREREKALLAAEHTHQLEVQMVEMKKLDQLKEAFINTINHELRTPIANMKLAIHMLEKVGVSEKGKRYLQILKGECLREHELVDDLLEMQQSEAGDITLNPESLDVEAWLSRLLDGFYERIAERSQKLAVHFSPPHLKAIVDRRYLERVLSELVNNACKYTPEDGNILLVVDQRLPQEVAFHVINDGPGIPATELPHLFKKFYRAANASASGQKGTGLGLALVHNLVQCMGGRILVRSEAQKTSFCVIIPTDIALPART